MRTIIAGSKSITRASAVNEIIGSCGWPITEVLTTSDKGVSAIGMVWARKHGIQTKIYPDGWTPFEKHSECGTNREKWMAHRAEGAIIVWDGKDPYIREFIKVCRAACLRMHVYTVQSDTQMSMMDRVQHKEGYLKSLKIK